MTELPCRFQAFGFKVDKHIVRRILAKHYKPDHPGGPSWLTFLSQTKDSLWSIDLFRCESINLRSCWVMLAIDVNTRRIIGFATYTGDVDGIAACRLFNQIQTGQSPPRRISTDHDPVFTHHRWRSNLRVLDIVSPYLIHRRPAKKIKRKDCDHWTQLSREMVTRKCTEIVDSLDVFQSTPKMQRPTFHEIRALSERLYKRAGIDPQKIGGWASKKMVTNYDSVHKDIRWVCVKSL